ncbi:MAG: hypothetical protein AB1327_01745 [Bacillota bacterium]|uniref:hypothetical protein n=1 Tax=Desulforudis sp. DRI-14 TaxID=3459793 RepID=UPI00347051BE
MSTLQKLLTTVLVILVITALHNAFSLPRSDSGDNKPASPGDKRDNYFLSDKTPLLADSDGERRDAGRVPGPAKSDTVSEPDSTPVRPAPRIEPQGEPAAPVPDENGLSPIAEKYRARFAALDAAYRERFFTLGKQAYDEYVTVAGTGGQVSRARVITRYLVLAKEIERDYDCDFRTVADEMARELALAGLPQDLVSRAEEAHLARKQELRRLLYEKGKEIISKDDLLKQNLQSL